MKRFILSIPLLFQFIGNSYAENRLIKENRVWEYHWQCGTSNRIEQYMFEGLQQQDGKEYHIWKLVKTVEWDKYNPESTVETFPNTVCALLREQEGKVFMNLEGKTMRTYDTDSDTLSSPRECEAGTEGMLYDFNVSPGDKPELTPTIIWELEVPDWNQLVSTQCEIMKIEGLETAQSEVRKYFVQGEVYRFILNNIERLPNNFLEEEIVLEDNADIDMDGEDHDSCTFEYAEILGNTGSGNMTSIMPADPIFLTSGVMTWVSSYLVRVYDTDGTVIYESPGFSGIASAKDDIMGIGDLIYGIDGKTISEPTPGSIYIRDGKKFVAE